MSSVRLITDIEVTGFGRLGDTLGDDLLVELSALFEGGVDNVRAGSRADIVRTGQVMTLLKPFRPFQDAVISLAGDEAVAVRVIFFDKHQNGQAQVPWHQGTTIAVQNARDIPAGFGPATHMQGIAHLRVPAPFMANMLSVRLHLDGSREDNGSLEIIPFSHRKGRLDRFKIHGITRDHKPRICRAQAGEVHFFRPLLLHRSKPSSSGKRRRVIQIEISPRARLPEPLQWYAAIPISKK